MGEAKRRRETAEEIGGETSYLDMGTGERRPARKGGDLEAFLLHAENGDLPPVPCNGCTTCCYHEHVDVYPEKERPEDFAHLLTEPHPDGGLQLQHRPDGACIHLGERGCTIYDHRPHACRKYDCQFFPMYGVTDGMSGGRQTPMWWFTTSSHRGALLKQAQFTAGLLTVAGFKADGVAWDATKIVNTAHEKVPHVAEALDALSRMTPQEFAQVAGVDPSTVTPSQFLEHSRKTMRRLGLVETAPAEAP